MPIENLENLDLYQALDVQRTDPSGAIHEAFIKLVPKHPPGKDPEGFRALSLAYQTLMDPKARDEYDNLLACGPNIENLMSNAFAAMVQGRLKRAEPLIRSIVEETGGASEAIMMLGQVQFEQGHVRDAIQTLLELVEKYPQVPLYRVNLGNMLMNRYVESVDEEVKQHVLNRARENYEKAIELDVSSHSPYIEMAKTYLSTEDHETAYQWTEKAVMANGREDFDDFDAFLFGYFVLAHTGDTDRMCNQLLRIESVLPNLDDAKRFVVASFVHLTFSIVRLRKFAAVRELILSSIRVSVDRKEIRDLEEQLKETEFALEADLTWNEFVADRFILDPVKDLAAKMFDFYMLKTTPERFEAQTQEFSKSLEEISVITIRESLARLKLRYPAIWKLNEVLWNELFIAVGGKVGRGLHNIPCWVWLIIVFALMYLVGSLAQWIARVTP